MKKLLIFLNLVSLNIFSQIVFIEGSDTALIRRINDYRVENGLTIVQYSPVIKGELLKKLKWMEKNGKVTHNDPFNTYEIVSALTGKSLTSNDETWISNSYAECLYSDWIQISQKDSLKAYQTVLKKLNMIRDSTIFGWKHSTAHNGVLLERDANSWYKLISNAAIVINFDRKIVNPDGTIKYAYTAIYTVCQVSKVNPKIFKNSIKSRDVLLAKSGY
jgi:hypothetical protein